MLVDVVPLRLRGVRRPRDEVLAAVPLRAELQLTIHRPGWHPGQRNAPLLAGLVEPGQTRWALPPLDKARVSKISGPSLLVVGFEEIPRGRREVDVFWQAWWCRLVLGGAAALAPRPAPPEGQHELASLAKADDASSHRQTQR